MFHCNGWGGVYALTGMGGTHVVLRAVDGAAIFDLIEREKVHLRVHGARRAAHRSSTTRTRRSTASRRGRASRSPARRRRPRSSSGSRRSSAGSSSRSTASPRPRRSSPSRSPDHATAAGRTGRAARAPACPGLGVELARRSTTPGTPVPAGRQERRRGLRPLERRLRGLLGAARGDREGDPRRLVPHRRPRRLGRDRQHPHRRPQEGRDHLGRREHQLARRSRTPSTSTRPCSSAR